MNVSLRLATPQDIPIIRELAHRIWWAHYSDIISPEQIAYMLEQGYSETAILRHMEEQTQSFWLVETDAVVAGFIAISQNAPSEYFIHKFYLDNTQRGRGIGAAAFQCLLSNYPDMEEVRLNVNRRNYKSVNFYFKTGFVITHCMDTFFGDGYVMDDFQMRYRKKG